MNKNEGNLDIKYLKEILIYNINTGIFTNKINRSPTARKGKVAGSLRPDGYISLNIDKVKYYAHRLAWFYNTGVWPIKQIDHIDNNRSNNAIINLREATNTQNQLNTNKRKNCSSKYKGVTWRQDSKNWRARIRVEGKLISLGNYIIEREAAQAYNDAAIIHFGEFTNINVFED